MTHSITRTVLLAALAARTLLVELGANVVPAPFANGPEHTVDGLRDFGFTIVDLWADPEGGNEDGYRYLVIVTEHGTELELERFTTDDPYGAVAAAREAQAMPLEERLDYYAELGL